MGGRKGCRLSILALGQSSKALRFGALSPPISQVSMETEARKEEEGLGVVMKPPASQAWSGGENRISRVEARALSSRLLPPPQLQP